MNSMRRFAILGTLGLALTRVDATRAAEAPLNFKAGEIRAIEIVGDVSMVPDGKSEGRVAVGDALTQGTTFRLRLRPNNDGSSEFSVHVIDGNVSFFAKDGRISRTVIPTQPYLVTIPKSP